VGRPALSRLDGQPKQIGDNRRSHFGGEGDPVNDDRVVTSPGATDSRTGSVTQGNVRRYLDMNTMRSREGLFVGLGIVAVTIGVALSIRPINDIAQEAQGHCDYLPCVTSTTVPLLAAFLAVALIGAFALFAGVRGIRRR
jgi:hypothetical protein